MGSQDGAAGGRTHRRIAIAVGAALAVVLAGGVAWALGAFDRDRTGGGVTADYPWYATWEELGARSSAVVAGTVTGVETRSLDPAEPVDEQTVATVRVTGVVSGPVAAGETLEVTYPGPDTPIDRLLRRGEHYVLVLVPYGDTAMYQFANPNQCVYPVRDGAVTNSYPNTFLPPSDVLGVLGLA